jgi:hypothetical protein
MAARRQSAAKQKLLLGAATVALVAMLAGGPTPLAAQQATDPAIKIGDTDLGGVVTSPNGPEAGVWVIAETTDLPTKMAKIVVTDDKGRYVLPDLPKAHYTVWVRGYGLIDSPKVDTEPGKILNLTAVPAPNVAAAAQYYPAIYWYAMLGIPDKASFPGTGRNGNGMSPKVKSQAQWLDGIKTQGCNSCHQIGNIATRTIPAMFNEFPTSLDAWARRVQTGQASEIMARNLGELDAQLALKQFADWTDRIAAGELPFAKPQRPQGLERNLVLTMWDWSSPKHYLHDEVSTDRRNPTVNANGPLYGSSEDSTDTVPMLDPVKATNGGITAIVRDPKTPASMFITTLDEPMFATSPYYGDERTWHSQTTIHNPMFDQKGRVWLTARIRPPATPAFCRQGSDHPSAKLYPMERAQRQLELYEPKSGKLTPIDLCFTTHHLNFAEDADNTLWFSGGGANTPVIGWFNTKIYDETGDAEKAQGWTPLILDTNGNGKRDEGYVGPKDAVDPTKDKQIIAGIYGVSYNPVDGTIWGSVERFPGGVVRLNPGSNPPATALAEYYEVPFDDPRAPINGYGPRGSDIDRNGVVWTPLASGHLASFDRRKCKGPLNGPEATGKQCPEGWTLYPFPGPQFKGVTDSGSAEASYNAWVDQRNILGLGANVPIATGNESDSLHALVDGKWVELRVPYPMGYFSKGLDGRIDDSNAGWKGRALWSSYGGRAPQHIEGGKGTYPKVVKFQLRPDPLAD